MKEGARGGRYFFCGASNSRALRFDDIIEVIPPPRIGIVSALHRVLSIVDTTTNLGIGLVYV